MSDVPAAKYRTLFTVVALSLVVLGVMSAMDVSNQTYTGYFTDGNNKVTLVDAGSPAAAAGLQVGDMIKSLNGVAVTDTKGFINMHRPAVGAAWPMVLERGGQTVNVTITMAALRDQDVYVTRAATMLGFCFLGFTLWAYFAAPGAATAALAVFGLSWGFAFLGTPYFESPALRNAVNTLVFDLILLGDALLVYFLLASPSRRPFLDRPSAMKILYVPAVVVAVLFTGFSIVQPEATSAVNVFFRTVGNATLAGYFLVAIIVLFRRFSATPAADRAAHGLGLMLAGAVLGLGPLLVSGIVNLVSPSTVLPGAQYWFLPLGLIPIAFSIAAVRSARRA
ncbi:MAG TPA: PDZ domain-containing protein [Gemmatimonadaceae bacterium]|nr:PDZ domain-containing protein [Gemmatimonadaceae bacterium]